MFSPRLAAIIAVSLVASSCTDTPRAYLEKGNKLAAEHKYQDASILYRKAIQKDPQFGEAVYRLALNELEQHNGIEGFQLLSRAVDLMPDNQEAKARLADLALALYTSDPRRPTAPYERSVKLADEILAKNPNSFDALRLKAAQAMLNRQPKQAIEYYRKANATRPMQAGLETELAQALLADGEGSAAETLAVGVISREPKYSAIYDILYDYYVRQNRVRDAEQILESRVRNKPEDADSRLQLARHYARQNKPDQIKTSLQPLLDDRRTFPQGRLQVADFYSKAGDWTQAREQYEQGLRLTSGAADKLPYEKGLLNALIGLGKREEALQRLASLVKEYPKNSELKVIQSSLWILSRQPARIQLAVAQLQELIKQNPDDVIPRYGLAQGYFELRDWNSARVEFQEILNRRRGNVDAQLSLAQIGLAQNKPDETLRYSDEILGRDDGNLKARLLRSSALISMGSYSQAQAEVQRILRTSPEDRDAQDQLGRLAILEKRYQDAERIYRQLRQSNSQDIRSTIGLVNTYVADNRHAQGIQLLNDDLKRWPVSAELRRLLADTATRAGQYDVAVAAYEQLLSSEPSSPQLHVEIARVYQLQADDQRAITHLRQAIQLSPNDTGAAALLGAILQRSGRIDEARAVYNRLLLADPDNAAAQNNLAYLLAESGGNLDEALRLAQRAQQKRPGDLNFADTLGWIFLKKNMNDSALQIFRMAVEKDPDNPTFRYHLGLALLQKGDKAKARSELNGALRKNPSKTEESKIREIIARIG